MFLENKIKKVTTKIYRKFLKFFRYHLRIEYTRIPGKPEMTETEECILECINEPGFSIQEKAELIDKYASAGKVSMEAFCYFVDRLVLYDDLRNLDKVDQ